MTDSARIAACGGLESLAITDPVDHVPGYEFDTVTFGLDQQTRTLAVSAVTELANPRPIGQFADVRSGAHTVTVALTLAGTDITSRSSGVNVTADDTVAFVITRDTAASCAQDSDCAGSDACSKPLSALAGCARRAPAYFCEADQRCILNRLCCSETRVRCRGPMQRSDDLYARAVR